MDFSFSSEQQLLKESVHKYLQAEIAPVVAECEAKEAFDWDLLHGLKDYGYIGGLLPEEAGGMGMSYTDWAILMEEAGYTWLSMRVIFNTINIVAGILHHHATDAQKEKYLTPLLNCEKIFWLAITEPNHGSDVAGVETKAVDKGDYYEVTGQKMWITNGIWGDFGILVAKTFSPTCDGGISLFLIDKNETKYSASRLKTMFIQSTATSELAFDEARVPKENLLGKEGEGLKTILAGLSYGRLNVALGAVGAAQCALDLATEYAGTRKQFGNLIGGYQLVQKLIVDMMIKTEAARALSYRAAWTLDQGLQGRVECSIAKLYASEAAHEVASLSLQVHGGMGYSKDYPIERIFRDTRGGLIPEGTSQIQTLIIGREKLGISAFK